MTYQNPLWEIVFSILATNLGADDFRQREAAQAALQQLAPFVVHRLHAVEKTKDREVATRVRRILDRYYAQHATVWANNTLPTDYPRLPWICELPSTVDQERAQYYLEQARSQIGVHGPPHWDDYRLATRLLIEDLYGSRVPRRQVIVVLDRLAEAERSWIVNFGHRYHPPVNVAATKK